MQFTPIRFPTLFLSLVILYHTNAFTPAIHKNLAFSSNVNGRQSSPVLFVGYSKANVAETFFEPPEDSDDEVVSSSQKKRSGISSSELRWTNEITEARRTRLEQEKLLTKRFLSGDTLHLLRQKVLGLRLKLQKVRERGDTARMNRLAQSILKAQQMDAEFIYQVSLERMAAASRAGLKEEAENYRREAMLARSALPQFNMEGLWIGRFGEEFQMVNVSYVGDLLIARKVTGNKNVPKGEISFEVDLSPKSPTDVLQPIELNEESTQQWGRRFLQRFTGRGQVAAPGHNQRGWMEGQMILVDKYFSFAWLPIARQVFFGRPSPELTLKMLRQNRIPVESPKADVKEESDDTKSSVEEMRAHISRCWEETEDIEDEIDVSDGIFKSNDQAYYYQQEGCFE